MYAYEYLSRYFLSLVLVSDEQRSEVMAEYTEVDLLDFM